MGEVAGPEAGPSRKWWIAEEESPSCDGEMDLDDSPSKSMLQGTNKGHQMKVSSLATPFSNSESNTEKEILKYWVTEDLRKQNMKILHSATDSTLVEEALRYGSVSLWRGERVSGSSHLIPFLFDRAPEGEHCDRSRSVGEGPQFEVPLCVLSGDGTEENKNGCWDLVETNGGSNKSRGEEWGSGLNDPQPFRGEKEDRWEESNLAKFSHFLGFSTEGLEKEILDFFIKIRKRRERIHGKVLLEKSKFERELKRLECSVNYEKGRKQRDPSQENKNPTNVGGCGEKLRFGEILRLEALDASGTAGGVLVEEIGTIRGLWEDPWLMDIPLQRGVFTWSGGPNNQSWLDWIEGGGLRRGPSSFRFENMWLKVEGFQDLIRSWWWEIEEVFGNLGCNKAAALQQVEFWDLVESDRILSVEETELKKEAKENYKKWVLLEETHWRQLSREIWLREGDRNTGYFHRMANSNRRNNYLDRIKIDGVCLSEEQEVREGIANAYQQMLLEDSGWQADIGRLRLDQISHQEAENLEALSLRRSSKGLRQGDPLSPYLFVMEWKCWGFLLGELLKGDSYQGELAVEIGCRVGSLPSQYLGLPLGAPNKASSVWDGVEERVRRRLALWKRQFISKGGRITLIKSTLSSIPIYQMSLFRMPKIVVRRLEKLQRDFLWGEGNMERKVHLVKWEIVCGDKERGGLGLRKLGLLNKALLGVWKEIMKETDWCWDNIEFMVGKGTKIRFWTDMWCAGTSLSQTFPHLFALAANRNATVEEMWDQNSDQGGDLLLKLRGLRPSLEEDSVSWKGGKNGKFKVKEAYSCLVNPRTPFFRKNAFGWIVFLPKSLSLRGRLHGEEESINHVLIHCIVARALWELVLGLVGVKWVFPEFVKEAKALAEKIDMTFKLSRSKKRDIIAESLDTKIKHWAAGKEGNLRALLSSLQYELDCMIKKQDISIVTFNTQARFFCFFEGMWAGQAATWFVGKEMKGDVAV
ncbi:putative ribonuclease H protein [Vitis vinifera]|uniref:Putative ribonuclease H protein n=1 Tax=Vitis vinifera TaxID=29760 RepID=A0A438ETZ7_VITVI|nr:putative ribonuclease H protein [Vitis vinifera]